MSSKAVLPDGWTLHRFDQMAENVNERVLPADAEGLPYVGLEHLDSESLKIRRWGSTDEVEAQKLRFYTGDIIFGKRRYYQKKLAVADFDGICSAHAMVLRAKSDVVLSEFLPFFMQSEMFFERAMAISVGSLSPTINWTALARQEFPLPRLDVQRRIAEILWAIEESTNLWTEVLQRTVVTKNAYLAHVFDSNEVKEKNWTQMPLKKCAQIRTGIAKGKKYGTTKTVTLPYLSVANVQDGYLDLTEIKQIIVAEDEVERYSLQVGDVLMTEGGDFNKLGRGTVWSGQINPCLHQNHVFAVRVDATKILPAFLSLQASSPYGKAYFLKSSKQTTNLASVNAAQVGRFPVLIPTIIEQEQIIQIVKNIEAEVFDTQHHLIRLKTLKKSLMQTSVMTERHYV